MNTVILRGDTQREYAHRLIDEAPADYAVTIKEPGRTDRQNRLLWPLLQDVSRQVEWHGRKLSKEEWKDMFSATILGQEAIPNFEGTGFIVVGGRTSTMSKRVFCDLVTLIYSFGDQRGVEWSDPRQDAEEMWSAAR